MTDRTPPKPGTPPRTEDAVFVARVDARVARKLKARRHAAPGVWFGLGTMGVIGWSVAIPTLLGTVLGSWLDGRLEGGPPSWTLAFLVGGLVLGCLIAWRWVAKEERAMQKERDDD